MKLFNASGYYFSPLRADANGALNTKAEADNEEEETLNVGGKHCGIVAPR